LQQKGFDFCYDKSSTTGWSTVTPGAFAFISALTLLIRRSCFVSSRTTTSLKLRLPVFLGRHPDEPVDKELGAFYRKQSLRANGLA
jgi:hypothetical protein